MTEKEFKLDEKRIPTANAGGFLRRKVYAIYEEPDIKEFIKRLRKEICGCEEFPKSDRKCAYCNRIDELAGDKLT